ncbi:hypothetical protein BATDEDRAFT_34893 [Batrachochytrium dendrobatidis JAM81]|uniref:Cytochrome P450 n=2 Tax=Batrachochytrium dendrobatidis TaxID=109871 RepID=F4P0S5_BATDJ|nr:uncharacterized protein BATDEDRAFT_34893 [Batrachochytrium dendrobatidis JAM81]EGF81331.1 hypothetical protein BATDEDRAFT_34893 [Batrachochytrium dendrobatidis JAM81]OAJ38023.1 hypothetical protein BDEG_21992 [Batrachochytrium dendrobatidis JEL423]|eukprot:XP_006678030.1 hypothetical protein BATDEDRAFT_34893 [Batrachochytrium dendrobatidis JAM81]
MDTTVASASIVTLAAGLAIVSYLQNYYVRIPGPYAYPIIGSGLEVAKYSKEGNYHLFLAWMRTFGPITRINIFMKNVVVTTDAALIKRATTSSTEFWRDPAFSKIAHSLLDNGLFTLPTGDVWKRHRKNLQPAFAPSHLRQAAKITRERIETLGDYWQQEAVNNGGSIIVDIFHEFTALTLDIIGSAIFSYDFHASDDLHKKRDQVSQGMVEELVRLVQERFSVPPLLWAFNNLSSYSSRVKKVNGCIHAVIQDVIDKRKEQMKLGNIPSNDQMDVLDRLLKVHQVAAENFTNEEVVGEVIGFFVAGHETTANTLVLTALEICRHPEIEQRLAKEVAQVEKSQGCPINIESVPSLKYLDMVVKESQRFHPVVSNMGRNTLCTIQHNGYTIPANTTLILNTGGAQKDPAYWDKPEKFDPERWADGFVPIPGSYVPFGDGPMACIGQKMALIEIKIVLSHVLSKFDMELIPDQDLTLVTSVTTGLKHGLKLRLTPKTVQ